MAFPTKKRPKEVIHLGIVINHDSRVLMIRRAVPLVAPDGSRLDWAFPGGKQESGESGSECVVREVLEETGFQVFVIHEIARRRKPQFGILIVYHLCAPVIPERVGKPAVREVKSVKWVKLHKVETLITTDLNPGVRRTLDRVRRSNHATPAGAFEKA